MFQAVASGSGGRWWGCGEFRWWCEYVSVHAPMQKHGVFAWAGVHRAERDGMSVFSNMESVALFINDVKHPNVTNHPHHEIPLPPWMCLLLQGNISSTVVGVFFWFH